MISDSTWSVGVLHQSRADLPGVVGVAGVGTLLGLANLLEA